MMSDDQDQLHIVESAYASPSTSRLVIRKDSDPNKIVVGGEQIVYVQGATPNEGGLVQVVAEENGVQQLLTLDLYNFTLINNSSSDQTYKLLSVEPNEVSGTNVESAIAASIIQADNERASGSDDGHRPKEEEEAEEASENTLKTLKLINTNKDTSKLTLSFLAKAREQLKAAQEGASPAKTRKRGWQLPPAHEMLASPNFKLYIFNCKFCDYKCNALKEMTEHKKECEGHINSKKNASSSNRSMSANQKINSSMSCLYCPYKAATKHQLTKHQAMRHSEVEEEDEDDDETTVMYVCSSCGMEAETEIAISYHNCKGPKMKR